VWPKRSGPRYDEQGDFIEDEVVTIIDLMMERDDSAAAESGLLSPPQAFQLLRMFRMAAAVSKNGVKWRMMDQTTELVAASCSAVVPVLVGLQTHFEKEKSPAPYWSITIISIVLSLLATLALVVERVHGMKEQGVIERIEGADINFELEPFVAGHHPYGPSYREHFADLSTRIAAIQHKGTIDLYSAFKTRSQDKTTEMRVIKGEEGSEQPGEDGSKGPNSKEQHAAEQLAV
jgi:hypothetical protein